MSERGEALLETVLIAPLLLFMGLVSTEYGASALKRAELSENIRSMVNLELINSSVSNADEYAQQIESILKNKLLKVDGLDSRQPMDVEVKVLSFSHNSEAKLPFFSDSGETILLDRPKELEVRVSAYGKTLFGSLVTIAPLTEIVRHRLRG